MRDRLCWTLGAHCRWRELVAKKLKAGLLVAAERPHTAPPCPIVWPPRLRAPMHHYVWAATLDGVAEKIYRLYFFGLPDKTLPLRTERAAERLEMQYFVIQCLINCICRKS